jgi:hypothetical protein
MKILAMMLVLGSALPVCAQTSGTAATPGGLNFSPECDRTMQVVGHDAEELIKAWDIASQPPMEVQDLDTLTIIIQRAEEFAKVAKVGKESPQVCAATYKRLPHYFSPTTGALRINDDRLLNDLGVLLVIIRSEPMVEQMKQRAIHDSQR